MKSLFIVVSFGILFQFSSSQLFYWTTPRHPSDHINISTVVDDSIIEIRNAIKRFGFDPMRVPNISDYVVPATINLTRGVMRGAGGMERDGDFLLTLHPYTVRLHARVRFAKLIGKFNYYISIPFYSDEGVMDAIIQNVKANMSIDYVLSDAILINPQLNITSFGNIKIKMTSESSWINWLKSIIANVAIPYYEKHVIEIAEKTSLKIAHKVLKYANKHMSQYIADIIFNLMTNFFR